MRWLALVVIIAGCGDDGKATSGDAAGSGDGKRTIDSCATSIGSDSPRWIADYYRCVTTHGLTIESEDLPPHDTNYYATGNANYVPFDTSRGSQYMANPNKLAPQHVSITFPAAPVAKGLTITSAMVDGVANTDANEYPLGSVGIAIDSVSLYDATAAPGDNIAQEVYTFDDYNAHPSPDGAYHYHTSSMGPLAVSAGGFLGVMCDGTVVLACDELDGTAPDAAALDAQGGHVGDVADATGVLFAGRYHVHVCPERGGRAYTPEIQYYTSCTR